MVHGPAALTLLGNACKEQLGVLFGRFLHSVLLKQRTTCVLFQTPAWSLLRRARIVVWRTTIVKYPLGNLRMDTPISIDDLSDAKVDRRSH
jgi:hypothetical protein